MGQDQCCQSADNSKYQLVYRFHNMNQLQPVQSPEGKLMISIANSVHSSNNQPSNKQGKFIQKRPQLNSSVTKRLQTLDQFKLSVNYISNSGQKYQEYFCFKRTGIVYFGQWKNGKPNGLGQYFYPNGGYFKGTFIDGVPHGFGRMIMANGDYYQGDIKFGRVSGKGRFVTNNGEYIGEFKDNLRHGKGQQKTQKLIFNGIFQYGDKKQGIMKFNVDNVYQGQFQNDLFEGKGKLTTSQTVYIGNFKNGLKHGKGQQKWKDGSYYKGKFYEGQREGQGQFYNCKNGTTSAGIWKNGLLQGQGQYIQRGKMYRCIWNSGKLVGLMS